jgi:hypothetical protein
VAASYDLNESNAETHIPVKIPAIEWAPGTHFFEPLIHLF